MAKSAKKVLLVGWDGAPPQMIERMIGEGLLENFAGLMKQGTFIYALNPYPTITAPNWTTLSTGSWPGRHGVTGYNVHHPGEPLDKIYSGFHTGECSSEHIWDAAEKVGRRCMLIHYETSWPPTLEKGIVVGGCGPNYQDELHKITADMVFSTEDYPKAGKNELVEVHKDGESYTAALKFETEAGEQRSFLTRWNQSERVVTIFRDREKNEVLASLREGEWSEPVRDVFLFEGERVEAIFRFRLYHLPEPADDEFKLLCTSIVPIRQFCFPPHIGEDLVARLGPYYPRGGWELTATIDPEEYLEYMDMYHDWLTGACQYLMGKEKWDLVYAQTHCHDYAHHMYMRGYDPITADKGRWSHDACESYMKHAYQSADRMLGQILECADEDTLIAVVSDHGAKTWLADVDLRRILVQKRLMTVDEDSGEVVWEKTKAVPQRACYVYVNLKGRDPDGIVEPGKEYDQVCEEVIQALHDYVEPETGKRPFSLALRREDARVLGLHGPRIGDVVYALRPEYGHEHGQALPTARYGRGSMEAIILLAGPGIKQGFKHEGMTGIQDVVPTLCYLTDIPFPNGCEGAIIYDALEDPSCKMREKLTMQKERDRWKDAYERQVSITHSRF